jgi:hypothetical protein
MRDPVSAALADRYAGGRPDGTQGIDAAFLLQRTPALDWRRGPGAASRVAGYSFGRALSRNAIALETITAFAQSVAGALQCDLVDIGWLEPLGPSPMQALSQRLSSVNACRFVVTDTYHCAVNAWRDGIPAVCIGLGADHPDSTLSEKKKELLFGLFTALDHYVFIEELLNPQLRERALKRVVGALADSARTEAVKANIARASAIAEKRLVAALGELVGA